MSEETKISNTSELRKVLVGVISSVMEGETSPAEANAIANISGKILQSAKLDIEMVRLGDKGNGIGENGMRLIAAD